MKRFVIRQNIEHYRAMLTVTLVILVVFFEFGFFFVKQLFDLQALRRIGRACSAQNIDRVVWIYCAAKQSGRTLIVDAYAAEILKATSNVHIPKPVRGWHDVSVFIPRAQRVHLVRKNIAAIVDSYRGFRLWPEQLPSMRHAQ